jgi:hypothetical protein
MHLFHRASSHCDETAAYDATLKASQRHDHDRVRSRRRCNEALRLESALDTGLASTARAFTDANEERVLVPALALAARSAATTSLRRAA